MTEWELLVLAFVGGILRLSPALVWAMVGDCLTQRSGHFNLGLEGNIACSAMVAVATTVATNNPWLGVVAAAGCGLIFSLVFALGCLLPRVSELGIGIALLVCGTALARFFGSGLIQEPVQLLPTFTVATVTGTVLLPLGLLGGVLLALSLRHTRLGLLITATGLKNSQSNLAVLGINAKLIRVLATAAGGIGGGVAGACLALFYPGGWSEQLATGIGIIAITLVFMVKSNPYAAIVAAVGFAALAALGPALQLSFGTHAYHLLNTLPYLVVFGLLLFSSRLRMLND